jgi:hypothetical protein
MLVRTIDPIDLNSARPGARFGGSLADSVKSSDGTVLIPRGSKVELRAVNVPRPGRMRPRDRIDLKVDSVTFNGKVYPIVSTTTKSRGARNGTAVAAASAANLRIASETVLSFQLQRALRVK